MEENNVKNSNQYLLNRKLRILIADDEKVMIDEILSNLNVKNEDYEIVGYAVSNEEEREKIEKLKPDIVITDIYRGCLENKNNGGFKIIEEYSEKNFLPKFIVISYTPYYTAENIIGRYTKLPKVNYNEIKKLLHILRITERSIFDRGYQDRKKNTKEETNEKVSYIKKIKHYLKIK